MHYCWVFNERMISILRPVLEYNEITTVDQSLPSYFHSTTADRQSDAFVNEAQC
jgi:hypothetical protein